MIIEKDKGGVISQLSFSIPNILKIQEVAIKDPSLRILPKYIAQGNKHQWVLPTSTNEVWHKLGSADPELRQQIINRITEAKYAFTNLQKGADPKQIDAIFNAPDNDEFVYYRADFDGTLIEVAIAGWGFRYPDNSQKKGVVMRDEGGNIQKVQVNITADGVPVANREFRYGLTSNSKSKMGITDKFGKCAVGNFSIGLEFFVFDLQSAKNFIFTVKKGQENYVCEIPVEKQKPAKEEPTKDIKSEEVITKKPDTDITENKPLLPKEVSARIQVIDQDGSPVPNFSVLIEHAGIKDYAFSDPNGYLPMKKMKVDDTFTVTEGESDSNRQNYVVATDKDTYIYRVDVPKAKEEVLVKLQVIDSDGMSVPNFPVYIEHNGQKDRSISDTNGYIQLKKMTVDDTFTVTDGATGSNRQDYVVAADKDTYIYRVDIPKIPEAKEEVQVKLQVVDRDGVAAPNFPVYVEYNGQKERIFSDNGGYVQLKKMTVDDTFSVTDGFSDTNREDYTVVSNKETYLYHLDYALKSGNKDITIHIIDEKGKPVQKDYVMLKLNGKLLQCTPDDKGCIYLDNNDFERDKPIKFILVQDGKEISADNFMLIPNEQEYTVQIDTLPSPWWKRVLEILATIAIAIVILEVFGLTAAICDSLV